MTESVQWLDDGTACSRHFGEHYHHQAAAAEQVFLVGCGLPAAWAGQSQWRVLETGFGLGLNFLLTWQAWRQDAARPRLLHFVATEAFPAKAQDLLQQAGQYAHLLPLAQELAAQWWGLLPGVHRLRLDGGRVLLTLLIGDTQTMLRQQDMVVDSIYLDGFSPASNPEMWSLHTLKAVARSARRGTRLASRIHTAQLRKDLVQCGFVLTDTASAAHAPGSLLANFEPAWEPRKAPLWPRGAQALATATQAQPRRAVVVGAGIAGAACAQQMAMRGWQVSVLDAAPQPAAGASALPAGIFAPHTSSDDSLLSRITRAGLRTTVQWAQQLLQAGQDWELTGVLERRQLATPRDETAAHTEDAQGPKRHSAHERPAAWSANLADAAAPWSQSASAAVLAAQGLPADDAALWHPHGGWLRPAALVQALLQQPGIRFVGNTAVAQIAPVAGAAAWLVQDAQGQALAQTDLVVVCAGPQSGVVAQAVVHRPLPLQPIRGQVSWGRYAPGDAVLHHPVNGHGSWVPFYRDSASGEPAWVMGSSFERDVTDLPPAPADAARAHAANSQRALCKKLCHRTSLGPAALRVQRPLAARWATVIAGRCEAGRRPAVTPDLHRDGIARPDLGLAVRRAAGGTPAWRATAGGQCAGQGPQCGPCCVNSADRRWARFFGPSADNGLHCHHGLGPCLPTLTPPPTRQPSSPSSNASACCAGWPMVVFSRPLSARVCSTSYCPNPGNP